MTASSLMRGTYPEAINFSDSTDKSKTVCDQSLVSGFKLAVCEPRVSFTKRVRSFFSCCIPRTRPIETRCSPQRYVAQQINLVTLSELEVFISDDESRMMANIAQNRSLGTLFVDLKAEDFNFALKKNQTPEVCKILYWGYKNKQLSATEFIEKYNQALVFLCFFPSNMPSPLNNLPDLATKIEILSPSILPLSGITRLTSSRCSI